jgi:hypothetical protein
MLGVGVGGPLTVACSRRKPACRADSSPQLQDAHLVGISAPGSE